MNSVVQHLFIDSRPLLALRVPKVGHTGAEAVASDSARADENDGLLGGVVDGVI